MAPSSGHMKNKNRSLHWVLCSLHGFVKQVYIEITTKQEKVFLLKKIHKGIVILLLDKYSRSIQMFCIFGDMVFQKVGAVCCSWESYS